MGKRRSAQPEVSVEESREIAVALARVAMAEVTNDAEEKLAAAAALHRFTEELSLRHGMIGAFEAIARVRQILTAFSGVPDRQMRRRKDELH